MAQQNIHEALEEIKKTPISDAATAVKRLHALVDKAQEADNVDVLVSVKIALGKQTWYARRYEDAIRVYEDVQASLEHQPVSKNHILVQQYLGHIYLDLGAYDQALEYYYAMKNFATQLSRASHEIVAEGNIGLVHSQLGDSQRAVNSHQRVIQLADDMGHRTLQVQSRFFLATEYLKLKQPQEAILIVENAKHMETERWEDLRFQQVLAKAYDQLGDDERAYQHYKNSLDFDEFVNFEWTVSDFYIAFGEFLAKIRDDEQAIDYLNKALALSTSLNYKQKVRSCHKTLYSIHKRRNEWQKALYHHEQFHDVDKAIFNDDSDTRIRRLEVTHQVAHLREVNEQQEREFKALSEMKDVFLSDVSHDLKNPLAAIRTSAYLARQAAKRENPESSHLKYLTRIDQHVDRMTQLIADVLDEARLSLKGDGEMRLVFLKDIVNEAISSLWEHAASKRINIDSVVKPATKVMAQANLLERAIENVLSNAIKYSPPDTHVRIHQERVNTDQICLLISDQGSGIPADELPKIFDRFFRGATFKNVEPGTGLGMVIVKRIIEKHNGTVLVYSTPGQGTTVEIKLPLPKGR